MSFSLATILLLVGILILIASLDDLVVDALALIKGRGLRIAPFGRTDMPPEPTHRIAIFVANWQEANVLGRMVEGNLENVSYGRVKFVLGVYPNDAETFAVAHALAEKHPQFVEVVVNPRHGPTSKGQMLNAMFARVFEQPEDAPDLVVLHDSEDVIAPRSFEVYASHASNHAMIQVPVFSLDARARSMVSATYMDEFAERHTRELLVREALGVFVPSAGVGTCLRKDLILHFLRTRGYVLEPGSVTEDYILGAQAHRDGFRTTFAAYRDPTSAGAPLIATLEYFPKEFWAAIKQRARWVYGICFDGTRRLGWAGSPWERFFLYRDRKGAITNLLPLVSLVVFLLCLVSGIDGKRIPAWQKDLLWAVLGINTGLIGLRLYFKTAAMRQVYGTYNLLGVILRWPVGMIINAFATARAWRTFLVESRLASRPIAWVKTYHELPAVFAPVTVAAPAVAAASSSDLVSGRSRMRARHRVQYGLAAACNAAAVLLVTAYLHEHATWIADHDRAYSAAISSLQRAEGADGHHLELAAGNRARGSELVRASTGFRPFSRPADGHDPEVIRAAAQRSLERSARADEAVLALATPLAPDTAVQAASAESPDADELVGADVAADEEERKAIHEMVVATLSRHEREDLAILDAAKAAKQVQPRAPEATGATSSLGAPSETAGDLSEARGAPAVSPPVAAATATNRKYGRPRRTVGAGNSNTFLRGGGCSGGSCIFLME